LAQAPRAPRCLPRTRPSVSMKKANSLTKQLLSWWHKLPTAWIHFVVVECSAVWAALGSWVVLIGQIQTTTSIGNVVQDVAQKYFISLFFLGFTVEQSATFSGVKDPYFIDDPEETPIKWFATYQDKDDCTSQLKQCTLVLPATSLKFLSANFVWLLLAWALPFTAALLVFYKLFCLARSGIWSFETLAYLEFTEHMYASMQYKVMSALMAVSPIGLIVLWVAQIVIFQLSNQLDALIASIPALGVLIIAIKTICIPWVRGQRFQEHGDIHEVLSLRVKRPIMHINPANASAHNAIWSLNIMRALLLAKLGRYDVMKEYMFVDWDADEEMSDEECRRVVSICESALTKDAVAVGAPSDSDSSTDESFLR